jgi:hypothetical protein
LLQRKILTIKLILIKLKQAISQIKKQVSEFYILLFLMQLILVFILILLLLLIFFYVVIY